MTDDSREGEPNDIWALPLHNNIGTSTTQQQQQHEQREMAGRGNGGGWQGGRTMTTHEQAGPNDDHVVWALGKFLLFVSFFLQLTKVFFFTF